MVSDYIPAVSQAYCLNMLRKQIKDCAMEYVAAETACCFNMTARLSAAVTGLHPL